jgi:hypothetical protein
VSDLTGVHFHTDEQGRAVRCYHACRSVFTWGFAVGVTVSFPIEHFIWEKLPGFSAVSRWLGL